MITKNRTSDWKIVLAFMVIAIPFNILWVSWDIPFVLRRLESESQEKKKGNG